MIGQVAINRLNEIQQYSWTLSKTVLARTISQKDCGLASLGRNVRCGK